MAMLLPQETGRCGVDSLFLNIAVKSEDNC
jgi:hypothetical protein